jgi:beta-glucanase (GH16 family)
MKPSTPTSPAAAGSSSPRAGEPAAIAGQGYHRVFRDDFKDLDSTAWGKGIWYDSGSPAGSIFAQNGILHLQSKRSDGYPNLTVTTEGGDQPTVFTQGYFEARMNWTGGNGAWPAFWLLSYRHAVNSSWPSINPYCAQNGLPAAQCYSAELDVFEGQGSEPNVFYGTVHRNSSEGYGVSDAQNANNRYDLSPTVLANEWHTYGMLWTANKLTWYLDGQELGSAPVYDSTNQSMFLALSMSIGGWTQGPDASTPDALDTEVDDVSVWQK